MFNKKIFTLTLVSSVMMAMSSGAFASYTNPDYDCSPSPEISPLVCFYTEVNFTGKSYCEVGERTVNQLKWPWKNSIKSIKLIDNASVKIYSQENRSGEYQLVEKNTKKLGDSFFDHLRSYRTVAPELEDKRIIPHYYCY